MKSQDIADQKTRYWEAGKTTALVKEEVWIIADELLSHLSWSQNQPLENTYYKTIPFSYCLFIKRYLSFKRIRIAKCSSIAFAKSWQSYKLKEPAFSFFNIWTHGNYQMDAWLKNFYSISHFIYNFCIYQFFSAIVKKEKEKKSPWRLLLQKHITVWERASWQVSTATNSKAVSPLITYASFNRDVHAILPFALSSSVFGPLLEVNLLILHFLSSFSFPHSSIHYIIKSFPLFHFFKKLLFPLHIFLCVHSSIIPIFELENCAGTFWKVWILNNKSNLAHILIWEW